jgi:hypothetical protein
MNFALGGKFMSHYDDKKSTRVGPTIVKESLRWDTIPSKVASDQIYFFRSTIVRTITI